MLSQNVDLKDVQYTRAVITKMNNYLIQNPKFQQLSLRIS